MPIDKNKLIGLIKDDLFKKKNKIARTLPITKTKDDSTILTELNNTFNDSKCLLQENNLDKTIPFIIWNDTWNEYGVFGPKADERKTYWRYTWGEKVYVDFGCGNIKTELSYPHPAIILYNFAHTVIVIPTTTDDKSTIFEDDLEDVIIKVKGDGIIFPNDTIINMHQPKTVHKERIINSLKCNVKNYLVEDGEIKRLNSRIGIDAFKPEMNLLECIMLKLTLMFNRAFFDDTKKLFEERKQMLAHINDIEGVVLNIEEQSFKSIKLKIEEIKKSLTMI